MVGNEGRVGGEDGIGGEGGIGGTEAGGEDEAKEILGARLQTVRGCEGVRV